MRRALAASLLIGASLLAVAGCGGSSSVADRHLSLDELSSSASTSADATSGRFAFDMSIEAPGFADGLSFSGEGAFDKASDRASFAVDMSALAKVLGGFVGALGPSTGGDLPDFDDPAGWKIEVVQDGEVGYVRFPAISKSLPSGKTWIRADGKSLKVDGLDVGGLQQSASPDPRQVLEILKAAGGEVQTVGTETLRGTSTTHYRATLDPAEVVKLGLSKSPDLAPLTQQLGSASGLSDVPVDVWLDDQGLVRKLALSVSGMQPGTAQGGSASFSFELWDYGQDVSIDVPPAGEVVDALALHS
jgi:hypothetical protein